MKSRLLPALIAAALASPALAQEVDSIDQPPPDSLTDSLPRQELTPSVLYDFLLAEIAGTRGQADLSLKTHMDLARTTRDPRIARRAVEIALFSRHYDQALEAVRLWLEAEPDAPQARQMLTSLLAVTGRDAELEADLAPQLAAADKGIGAQLLQLSRTVARHPDKKAAQSLVDRLTEPYLSLPEAHFVRAQAAYAAGNPPRAAAELDQALVLRPDWEQAVLARAQLGQNPDEIARYLGQFVSENPKAKEVRLAYARSLVAAKQYSEARQQFQTLLADNSENGDIIHAVAVLSLQLNDADEAEKQFRHLAGMKHQESESARLYLGEIAEKSKRFDEALRWYGEISGGDKYLQARLHMAQVQYRQQKLDEARSTLHETAATSPDERARLLIAESQLLRDAARLDDAYAVLADGLTIHPGQPDLLYEAAMMAEKVGKPDAGELHLRKLIVVRPDYAHASNALGYSLAERNIRLDEAKQLIDRALELAPDDPFILDSKGWVLFRLGDAEAALEVLKKAFSLRGDPEIAAHLGEVLWSLDCKDEARRIWSAAAKANPDNETLAGTIRKFIP
ncbi:MAG: tetratricopeptide repeat protein [Zoogloeaceae bacterium]|nr:tetratricopeptide repeat protein [Zoogloeaceae bacterium]